MYLSNLAALLEELEPRDGVAANTIECGSELALTPESPLTADQLETLLGPAPPLGGRTHKRPRFVPFRDNFSGDFRPFRIR